MYDAWLSRPRPLAMVAMTRPPMTASLARPLPPNRLVPPMTAAPTAYSSMLPPPDDVETLPLLDAAMMPLSAAIDEPITNTEMRIRSTLMPARRAASGLPPTAYTCRP